MIASGVLLANHVHMFAEITPHIAASHSMQRVKGLIHERFNKNFKRHKNVTGTALLSL